MVSGQLRAQRDSEGGVALLAVLWTLTLLGLMALALTNSVQDEVQTATYRKEATQAYSLACGGVSAAIMAIAYPLPENAEKTPYWAWKPGQREGFVPFEGGGARLLIESESGKVDLNFASREDLARLFEARGLATGRAEMLAAAILHWRAPEQEGGPEAEALDEYYEQAGIRPRHNRFQSLDEVLNVRGMSREIFYGTVEVSPEGKARQIFDVGQDLTVMSDSPQVNLNYASEYVLMSLPGMTPDVAAATVRERKNGPFRSVDEAGDRTAVQFPDESLPYLTTAEGNAYQIISIGEIAGSAVRRGVKAIIQIDSQAVPRYRLVAWYDDVSGTEGGN